MEQLLVVSGRSLVKIAKIKGPSGIKGDIKIVPIFFTPNELRELLLLCKDNVYAVLKGSFPKRMIVSDMNEKDEVLVVKLTGIDTRSSADPLKDADVYVDNKTYMDYLRTTSHVIRLIGYTVVDKILGEIGMVKRVLKGKQVIVALDEEEKKLIPLVDEFVVSVDDDKRIITMSLPEGLLEL